MAFGFGRSSVCSCSLSATCRPCLFWYTCQQLIFILILVPLSEGLLEVFPLSLCHLCCLSAWFRHSCAAAAVPGSLPGVVTKEMPGWP